MSVRPALALSVRAGACSRALFSSGNKEVLLSLCWGWCDRGEFEFMTDPNMHSHRQVFRFSPIQGPCTALAFAWPCGNENQKQPAH